MNIEAILGKDFMQITPLLSEIAPFKIPDTDQPDSVRSTIAPLP